MGSAGAGREGRRWLWGWWCVHGRYAVPSTSRNLHEGICVKCTKMKIVKSYALQVYSRYCTSRDFCHVCGVGEFMFTKNYMTMDQQTTARKTTVDTCGTALYNFLNNKEHIHNARHAPPLQFIC
mgnify:CR=1 FL=1